MTPSVACPELHQGPGLQEALRQLAGTYGPLNRACGWLVHSFTFLYHFLFIVLLCFSSESQGKKHLEPI